MEQYAEKDSCPLGLLLATRQLPNFSSDGWATSIVLGHHFGMKVGFMALSVQSLELLWKTPFFRRWSLKRQTWSATCQVSSIVGDSISFEWNVQKAMFLLSCSLIFFSCHTWYYLCYLSLHQLSCSTGYFYISWTLYETLFQLLINLWGVPCVYLKNSIKLGIDMMEEKASPNFQRLIFAGAFKIKRNL